MPHRIVNLGVALSLLGVGALAQGVSLHALQGSVSSRPGLGTICVAALPYVAAALVLQITKSTPFALSLLVVPVHVDALFAVGLLSTQVDVFSELAWRFAHFFVTMFALPLSFFIGLALERRTAAGS